MHHSWWSYNKTATHQRWESPDFSREIELIDSNVWVKNTTLLYSIFLPVLVKAIPCIRKDLRMCTEAYASLMVELQQDGYTSKMRESRLFEGNRADWFECLGINHYLAVLYFPASACQSHPMYRWGLENVHWSICITHGGVTTRRRHIKDWESPDFSREIELIDSNVWVKNTTLLYSIFLPVLVKAIPCIRKDLRMCTEAYAHSWWSYNKTATHQRWESPDFSREIELIDSKCLGDNHYLAVLYFPASACQSHPMYR